MSDQTIISFSEQDIDDFSEASGDRNPLHRSQEYARRTPYGRTVVFGSLGAMACVGQIQLPTGWYVKSLETEFLRPMFTGVNYRIETSESEDKWEVRLFDGSTLLVLVRLAAALLEPNPVQKKTDTASAFNRSVPVVRHQEDIVTGLEVSGPYACNAVALTTISERWGVKDRFLATVLSWSSYLVGMELPGESALFFKLSLNFSRTVLCPDAMVYRASVAYSGFEQIKIDVSLLAGNAIVASGKCWSYIRPKLPEVEKGDPTLASPDSLVGRTAVLIGSSRGLGAAIKRALESRGAVVFGMARSASPADVSRTEVGDAGDPEALQRLHDRVTREHDALDFLICNASPPILPLQLEPNSAERIGAYINLAVSLALTPLAEFLDLLNRTEGCVVIISSAAVEHPVKDWPHYVAAKRAVEALACVASLQYPRVRILIVRPQKLLTAMTNTPMGRFGATSPELLADRIAARLEERLETGKPEILE